MATDADVVINLRALLGEGPVWDHRVGRLAWVDILGGFVHLTDPAGGVTETIPVGPPVGAVALAEGNDYLLAVRDGFALLAGGRLGAVESVAGPGMRMNDGGVDPAGRFLAGAMALDHAEGAGSLYVREPSGTTRSVLGGLTVSNGLAWSGDGSRLYYVDSVTQAIEVFEYEVETAALTNRRRLVEIDRADGIPDGLTIDADGHLWVALWGGGEVRRYTPSGDLDRVLTFPAARTSACGFGGPDLDRLYVTTASVGAEPGAQHELDGALFVADPGCRGVPAPVARVA